MDKHIVLGVHVTNRIKDAGPVQHLLTEYGCNIKTRVGLHEVGENICGPGGIIVLEMFGDETVCLSLADKLNKLEGVEAQRMVFSH